MVSASQPGAEASGERTSTARGSHASAQKGVGRGRMTDALALVASTDGQRTWSPQPVRREELAYARGRGIPRRSAQTVHPSANVGGRVKKQRPGQGGFGWLREPFTELGATLALREATRVVDAPVVPSRHATPWGPLSEPRRKRAGVSVAMRTLGVGERGPGGAEGRAR